MISNAATEAENVVGLVFVAAFAPEEDEALGEAAADSTDSVLNSALVPLHYPAANGGEPAVEFAIDPARFKDAFAADLPAEEAAVMAATQRPVAEWRSPSGPGRWPGRACRRGASSPRATRRPAPISSARWRSGPARPSPRSTART